MKKSKLFVIMLALSLMICALPVCAASSTTEAAAGTEAAEKPDREAEGYNDVEVGGVHFQMPTYFGQPVQNGNVVNFYAETGPQSALIQTTCLDKALDADDFERESFLVYDSFTASIQCGEDVTNFQENDPRIAELDCGLICMSRDYSFTMEGVDFFGNMTLINNPENNTAVIMALNQSAQSEYNYVDAFVQMINGCTTK